MCSQAYAIASFVSKLWSETCFQPCSCLPWESASPMYKMYLNNDSQSLPDAQLCCAVLCCAVLCCAVLCCAVLCCAVMCSVSGLSQCNNRCRSRSTCAKQSVIIIHCVVQNLHSLLRVMRQQVLLQPSSSYQYLESLTGGVTTHMARIARLQKSLKLRYRYICSMMTVPVNAVSDSKRRVPV